MKFSLDTNICSAIFRRPGLVAHRLIQYGGRLFVSTIVLAELMTWAYSQSNPNRVLDPLYNDLLKDVQLLPFDERCAVEYGIARAEMTRRGIAASEADLMIAAAAIANDLILVTNNTADFSNIPNLRIVDWLQN